MSGIKRSLPSRQELSDFAAAHFKGRGAQSVDMILHLLAAADEVRHSLYQQNGTLSEGRLILLTELKAKGRPLPVSELAANLGVSAATCSVMVKRMLGEKEPLIAKQKTAGSGHISLISLTEQGNAVLSSVLPEHFEALHKLASVLTDTEQEILILLLSKLRQA